MLCVGAGLGLLAGSTARADVTERCIDAHAESQKLRRAGQLRAAQTELVVCADAACPEMVRGECARWHEEVAAELPAVLIEARDGAGRPIADVRVYVDGELVEERLTGTPLTVDPGEHVFRLEQADGTRREQRLLLVQGIKSHRLQVDFAPAGTANPTTSPPTAPAPAAATPGTEPEGPQVPVAFYPLAGVAVVGLGLLAGFGITAANRADELESTCAPNCPTADAQQVRTQALVADISLGVGAAAAVAAIVVLAVGLSEDPEPRAGVSLVPAPGGAWLGWSTAF